MLDERDHYQVYYQDKLWNLLPAIYRSLDSASFNTAGPLREMVNRIGAQGAILRRSIDRLWEDQSIETCDDWVVSYIGDLLATNLVASLDARGQRSRRRQDDFTTGGAREPSQFSKRLPRTLPDGTPRSSSSSAGLDGRATISTPPSAGRLTIPILPAACRCSLKRGSSVSGRAPESEDGPTCATPMEPLNRRPHLTNTFTPPLFAAASTWSVGTVFRASVFFYGGSTVSGSMKALRSP